MFIIHMTFYDDPFVLSLGSLWNVTDEGKQLELNKQVDAARNNKTTDKSEQLNSELSSPTACNTSEKTNLKFAPNDYVIFLKTYFLGIFPGNQLNVMEEVNKLLTSGTVSSNGTFKRCQEPNKQDFNGDSRVNNIQINHLSKVDDPCNSAEETNDVIFSKIYFWAIIFLAVLIFLDIQNIISRFIIQKLDIGIGVGATIVLGLGIPELLESLSGLAIFGWLDIQIVIYLMAYSLMFLSLVLRCASRLKWLSFFLSGAAYTCSTFGIVSVLIGNLPPEYIYAFFGVLVCLVVIWVRG